MLTKLIFVDNLDDIPQSSIANIQAKDNLGIMRYTNKGGITVYAVTCDYLLEHPLLDWCCGLLFYAVEFHTHNVLERDIEYSLTRIRQNTNESVISEGISDNVVLASSGWKLQHKDDMFTINDNFDMTELSDDIVYMLEGNISEVDMTKYVILSSGEEVKEELESED